MNIRQTTKTTIFWTITSVVIAFNGFLCSVFVADFYQVAFTEKEKEYHWGAEAFGWYYATRNTYLTYTATWTAVFLISLAFQIYFAIEKNKVKELYTGLSFVLLLTIMMITNGRTD